MGVARVLDHPLTARDVLRAVWRIDAPCPTCQAREQPVAVWTAEQSASASPVRVDWDGARQALDRLARPPKRTRKK